MIRVLLITLLLTLSTALRAGVGIGNHYEDDLNPADFSKLVIVSPIPGTGSNEPWLIDDPDIIIDDDEPSDEDEGLIYSQPPTPFASSFNQR
jgi:hypothetical protein